MDIGKLLGGIDLNDAKNAIQLVLDNKDALGKVSNLVGGLPDDVVGFLSGLPKLLGGLGGGLAGAGEQAKNAANALVGEDGESGARTALTGSASVMDTCREQLGKVASLLSGVSGELNAIAIPGIGTKLFEGPAGKISEGADTINSVVGQLEALGGHLNSLSGILGTVGGALGGLGDKLNDSGSTIKTLLPGGE